MRGYPAARSAIPTGWKAGIASLRSNQTSVFLGTKLAAEQMAKTGGGSIVNISSIMGFVGGTD
jgi:short-subunit dehydrogenase